MPYDGLSRMKGNFQVRFLGEVMAATPCPYPMYMCENTGHGKMRENMGQDVHIGVYKVNERRIHVYLLLLL